MTEFQIFLLRSCGSRSFVALTLFCCWQIEDLRKLIEDLKEDVKNVKTHHSEILSTPIPDES